MGILVVIIGFMAIIGLIDLVATRYGVDSRSFSTDRRAPRQELSVR